LIPNRINQRVNAQTAVIASRAMKPVRVVATALLGLVISGCALQTALEPSFVADDARTVIQRSAADMPLPESATVFLGGSVVTGSGDNWAGRIDFVDPQRPLQLMRFFVDRVVAAGWTYTSSTIAKTITLNFQRNGRRATIWIYGQEARGGFLGIGGAGGDGLQIGPSRVTIAVNHADAIEQQSPFLDLPPLPPVEPIASVGAPQQDAPAAVAAQGERVPIAAQVDLATVAAQVSAPR
jgi:hypothetical protein